MRRVLRSRRVLLVVLGAVVVSVGAVTELGPVVAAGVVVSTGGFLLVIAWQQTTIRRLQRAMSLARDQQAKAVADLEQRQAKAVADLEQRLVVLRSTAKGIDEKYRRWTAETSSRLSRERAERILADAAASSGGGRDVLVLVTVQRTGSTLLFDRIRRHPAVEVEGCADTWRALRQHGRRYPQAFCDVDARGQAIEVQDGIGAMIPGRPATGEPSWFVEKTHPEFFDFEASRLVAGIESLVEAGRRVEIVLGVRDPIETMWSMSLYQRRDPSWYGWLDPAGIPEFVASSLETLAAVAAAHPCRVMDYAGPESQRAILRSLAIDLFGDASTDADIWLDTVEAETVGSARVSKEGSGFIGAPTTARDPAGPEGIWSDVGADIERAAAAYDRLRR